MAEYGDEVRQEYGEGEDSLEETTAANAGANNSIIGKMRSSVTSILPNSLSKWFSPSSNNNNDSANGSFSNIKRNRSETEVNTPHAKIDRRNEIARRRIAVNDYAEDDDDDGDELEDDEAAEESNHSDDAQMSAASATGQRRRHLNVISPIEADQPPSKRSRMTLDGTMLSSRPLIASTPAINSQRNSMAINNHYGHLNLYSGTNRKELGYNFYAPAASASSLEQHNTAPDIIDLIPIQMTNNDHDTLNVRKSNEHNDSEAVRSRRTLNIPSTGVTQLGSTNSGSILPSLKRQSLSAVKTTSAATDIQGYKSEPLVLHPALELEEVLLEPQTYNGSDQPKFQNGATNFEDELRHQSVTDSEPEDADTVGELPTNASGHSTLKAGMTSQRAASARLFNMSTGNSRSGSRTSSFGNGLNFYTHLEGRKSLFAGNHLGNRMNIGNPLNSSTLSLNSLSRRQFNASIYGSTSALSDSRLLNTSSPFYKGNTTYGGAAAYSKYTTSLGSNSRLTPTLIRPTSSLSTLSSSSNSIVAGAGTSNAHGEQNPAISGTAKTILDLLNGFTTPLSEAKKMASNLRQQPMSSICSQTKSKRLTDADLHASRAMRLQQVRTPYMRPAVMLQPKKTTNDAQMPPVRELQVPSMSQLLQMKKLQTLTERSRQITMQKSYNEECSIPTLPTITKPATTSTEIEKTTPYTLPTTSTFEKHIEASVFESASKNDCKQQKHVNKIKHKIANPLRAPDIPDESPPIPANLPNIAFPMMTGMPKIDIVLPTTNKNNNAKETETMRPKANETTRSDPKRIADNFKFSSPVELKDIPSSLFGIEPSAVNFEFSKPATVESTVPVISVLKAQTKSEDVTISKVQPDLISAPLALPKSTVLSAMPTLKSGSVLDALKKPFVLPKSPCSNETPIAINSQPLNSFGSQFKKSDNEWECDTCMIRNKESAEKCVACDVPRKAASMTLFQKPLTTTASIIPLTTGFGDQFKKQSDQWECDTCMIRNKSEVDKCVSCETARKTKLTDLSQSAGAKTFGRSIFENPLKPPASNTFVVAPDSGFKTMAAAQKASKWECEACMTRNESSRSKCACCEQPKPGTESQKGNEPSFNFGATAVSKYSFGFGAGTPDPAKENELNRKTSVLAANTNINSEKTSVGIGAPTKGFQFGTDTAVSTTKSNNFSFGFQPNSNITPEKSSVIPSSKDTLDSSTKAPGFSFGLANTAYPKENTTLPFSATTTKDEKTATSTATSTTISSTITTTVMTTMASFTPPKVTSFSFENASAKPTQGASTLATTKSQGLAFGVAFQKPETSTVANTVTAVSTSSASKLSFPMTTTTTGKSTTVVSSTTTSSVAGTTPIVGSAFSFGVVSTNATSTTTTAKPMFSFGSSSVPSTSAGNVSSSTVSLSTNGGAVTNSTSISAVNVVFGFTNSTPSVLAPTTTAETKLSFSINSNANTNSSSNLTTFTAFGSPKSNPQTAITTSTNTAAPAFGSFTFGSGNTNSPKTESLNLFGTLASKTQGESKPIATAVPIFGNAAVQDEPKTTTSNSWPKNNTFLFGSPANTTATKIGNAGFNEPPSKAVFGGLKAEATESTAATNNLNAASLIFGNVGASSLTPSFGGNSGTASTVIFGTGSTAPTNTTNLFGGNNNTTVPQFGAISSGQTALGNNLTATTPAFGNTAAVGFGSFGSAAVTATATSTTNSEANTQPATTPFTFGAPQTQSTTSGYNFGTTAVTTKPAFNFTSTNQPTFNFTGSSAETTQNSTRPFQFGATAAPSLNASPVFGFGGAPSTETTSNTPFQFNAGSSQAHGNIFAPAPTASTTTQAARRKVRIPNRRLPPR